MNRTSKSLLSLMAVITLLLTLWFIATEVYIPYLTDFFETLRTSNAQVMEVIAIVFSILVALFALVMLGIALMSRTSEKDLKLQDGHGNLTVPKKSMEQIINKAVAEDHHVGNIDTKVRVRSKDHLQAKVSVEDLSNDNYRVNARDIQRSVQESVQRHLGLKSDVKVQIIPRQHSKKSLKVV